MPFQLVLSTQLEITEIKMKNLSVLLLVTFLGWGCASNGHHSNDHLIQATAWFQSSAEYKALSHQAYNIATLQLKYALKNTPAGKKRAIVLDLDETVLDNSAYQATMITEGFDYPTYWAEWVAKEEATAVPGAKEFLDFAKSQNVEIFYITNRSISEIASTVSNLKKLGIPVKDQNVLGKDKDSNKTLRRDTLAKSYNIVLFVGDNINDFSEFYYKKSVADKNAQVEKDKAQFGRKFIVLPNPLYGDWESAIFEYDYSKTPEVKNQNRLKQMRFFKTK